MTAPSPADDLPPASPPSRRGGAPRRKKQSYSRALKDLARFLWERGRTLTHATERDAAAWVRTLKRPDRLRKYPLAGATIFRKILSARGFFEQVRGWAARNPFGRFRTRRSDRPQAASRPPSRRELGQLLRAIAPDSPWGVRNRAILLLRLTTPLRISEICQLRRTQLLLDGRRPAIRVVRRGGNVMRILLRDPVRDALREQLRQRGRKGPYLFQAISSRPGGRLGALPLSPGWVSSLVTRAVLAMGAGPSGPSRRSGPRRR